MTAPINPFPIGGYNTASRVTEAELRKYSSFESMPENLQAMATVIILIDPDGNIFHLNGPLQGLEGVQLYQTLQGEHHLPFEQIITESAYQLGATIERQVIKQRLINFRVLIGKEGMNTITYRLCESRFWRGLKIDKPCWWGVFTRPSGWRWIQVWPMKTIDTAQKMDPVAYGNNMAVWDVNLIAPRPYYSKPAFYPGFPFGRNSGWKASESGDPKVFTDKDGVEREYYFGSVSLANRGDMETYVVYLIEGAGFCQIQDNDSDRMASLPEIFDTDGLVQVNTDPVEQTITSANEPHDNLFYKIARSVGLLKFFLVDNGQRGVHIWERKYVRFMYSVPPETAVTLDIMHTNSNAIVTPVLAQRFQRSR